tara:strand:+ start:96 stop:482 length:387 start_codon:yes stop_codon:yes gene_type:complete
MKDTFREITLRVFAFVFFVCSTLIIFHTQELYASENVESVLIKKVSKSYTKKFCNAIGFGLSKESAMSFALKENNQVFSKRKDFNNINKELLAEETAIEVIEKCGYPINLSGDEGIQEFKSYFLSKDQ